MNLKEQIKAGIPAAMKAKDKIRLETLRSLTTEIQYEEIQKKIEPLPDQDTIPILKREIKKRQESLDYAEKGNRADMAADLKLEIQVIESFLPSQLSDDKLREILKSYMADGANMGLLMKKLKDEYQGQYDSKRASEIAKEIAG